MVPMRIAIVVALGVVTAGLTGCPEETSGDTATTQSDSTGITDTIGNTDPTGMTESAEDGPTMGGDNDGTADGTADGMDTNDTTETATATATGGGLPGGDCNGTTYACGDGMDNDDDGLIDLEDPECVSPCDDDEGTFATGLPGDGMDCKQDCFFDGNSGHGDDGCEWDLRCDPANPGAHLETGNCEYTGGNICDMIPAEPTPECLEFCAPYVPPGCDCWGCCEVQTDAGPIYIHLNSPAPCSLAQLDACIECTPQIDDCGTPCVPEECTVCFGETEPPEGCGGENECLGGDPCESNTDCPETYFCYLNCCYPPPPG